MEAALKAVYKTKKYGLTSSVGSTGLVCIWLATRRETGMGVPKCRISLQMSWELASGPPPVTACLWHSNIQGLFVGKIHTSIIDRLSLGPHSNDKFLLGHECRCRDLLQCMVLPLAWMSPSSALCQTPSAAPG